MKKLIQLIPLVAAIFFLAGCGNNPNQSNNANSTGNGPTNTAPATPPGTNGPGNGAAAPAGPGS